GDEQRRVVLHRADLAHLCVHTVRVLTLEAGVQRKVALGAVPAEDVQAVVVAILATGRHDARLASGTAAVAAAAVATAATVTAARAAVATAVTVVVTTAAAAVVVAVARGAGFGGGSRGRFRGLLTA